MVRRLLYLNGLAVLGVVLNHAIAWSYIALFWWAHRYRPVASPNFDQMGSLAYYILRAIEQAITFSIPAFLFVSGFFVAVAAGRTQATIRWSVVASRIQNFAIPYLLWSLLIFISDFIQSGQALPPLVYLRQLATGGAADPFYYVPLIVQLYLLAPLLTPLARARPRALLLGSGLLQLVVMLLSYVDLLQLDLPALRPLLWLTTSWLFPGHLFWFVGGIVVGFHLAQVKALAARLRWSLVVAVVVLFFVCVFEWETLLRLSGRPWIGPRETLLDCLFSLAVLLAFLAFDRARLPAFERFSALGPQSFGVYLVHSLVLEYTARGIYHRAPALLGLPFLFLPILVTLGLGLPLLLMTAVRRSPARPLYTYLFG